MQKFDYDSKYDDLFVFNSESKSKGAIEFGDLVIDFDNNMKVVGLELINASEYLSKIVDGFDKKLLSDIKQCNFSAVHHKNMIIIKLSIVSENQKMLVPIQIPGIRKSSPAI